MIRFSCSLLLSLCVALLFFGLAHAAEPDTAAQVSPLTLSLEDAVKMGLEKSPLIRSAGHGVAASSYGRKAAIGALLPRLDSYASYHRLSDPSAVVPIKQFGGKAPVFSRDHYSMGIVMKIPIFEGGRNWRRLTSAEISEAISRESLHLSRQELVAGITNMFNRILYLEKLVESQEEILAALKKAEADAKKRLEVGRIAPVDLMRISTQVAEQEQALVTAREDTLRSRQTLARMIGMPPSWQPRIAGTLSLPATEVEAMPKPKDISRRPDVIRAEKEVRLAENQVKYEMGYHLPSVDLVGDYGRRAGSGFDGNEEVWTGGVEVSFNIFSGGSIDARVRQARAKLLAAQEMLRHTRLTALTEVENALSDLREARKRYAVAEKSVETARETWRIEELKYRTGAGTVTDSLLSQSAWSQAEAARLAALYQYQAAQVAYELATGSVDAPYIQDRESRAAVR